MPKLNAEEPVLVVLAVLFPKRLVDPVFDPKPPKVLVEVGVEVVEPKLKVLPVEVLPPPKRPPPVDGV